MSIPLFVECIKSDQDYEMNSILISVLYEDVMSRNPKVTHLDQETFFIVAINPTH